MDSVAAHEAPAPLAQLSSRKMIPTRPALISRSAPSQGRILVPLNIELQQVDMVNRMILAKLIEAHTVCTRSVSESPGLVKRSSSLHSSPVLRGNALG